MCYKAIVGAIVLLSSFVSCKKESKTPIDFYIKVQVPYDSTAVGGATYIVKEYKGGGLMGPEKEYTDFELKGTIDENGYTYVKFYPKKNTKYQYEIAINFDNLNVPFGSYSVINPPTYDVLLREDFGQKTRDYDVKVLPLMDIDYHFQNQNCFDENDHFEYAKINLEESSSDIYAVPFLYKDFLQGCADFSSISKNVLGGRYIYHWEAIKNGVTTTKVDTVLVAPGKNDQINIFW